MEGYLYAITYLHSAIEQVEPYLLSNEVYWPLGIPNIPGERSFPKLTLGWVLFYTLQCEHWVRNGGLSHQEATQADQILKRIQYVRTKWSVAWERKAKKELMARLKIWGSFLSDFQRDPEEHACRYAYEVNRRVLVGLLRAEAGVVDDAEEDLFGALETVLRAYFVPGEFVWSEGLKDIYGEKDFWYLYGTMKGL